MVHALDEIRRVLVPGGLLIDLRPLSDHWAVEVETSRERREAGRVSDLPAGLADDEAANQAVAEAEAKNWFQREHQEFFPFYYTWDSPVEMQEYIEKEWEDFIGIDEEVWKELRSMWAVANADARVRVRVKMLITLWRRRGD